MQAPIEVTERSGEVFLLDILSHRMSEMAMLRQPPHGNARAETHPGRVMSRPSAVRGYIFI